MQQQDNHFATHKTLPYRVSFVCISFHNLQNRGQIIITGIGIQNDLSAEIQQSPFQMKPQAVLYWYLLENFKKLFRWYRNGNKFDVVECSFFFNNWNMHVEVTACDSPQLLLHTTHYLLKWNLPWWHHFYW
jgi:hypothetical protein